MDSHDTGSPQESTGTKGAPHDYSDTRELRRAKGIIACAECRR